MLNMRILIVKNRYKKKVNLKKGLDYLAKNTPLKLEIEEVSTDFDLAFKKVGNDSFNATQNVAPDGYYQELRKIAPEGKYDVICLVYGNKATGIRVSFTDNPLWGSTDVIVVVKDDSGDTFSHELLHVLRNKLLRRGINVPDVMDKAGAGGTYTATQNRDEQIKLLAPYWDILTKKQPALIEKIINAVTPKPMYVYFKESEIVGLKPELVARLDKARDIAQTPFKITSGLRTIAENKKAGGVEDSSHLSGLACDIACPTSDVRWKIINGLLKAGFTRIGIGETFVHCDVDTSKSGNVIWHYYK